jgi:hypothetical protein
MVLAFAIFMSEAVLAYKLPWSATFSRYASARNISRYARAPGSGWRVLLVAAAALANVAAGPNALPSCAHQISVLSSCSTSSGDCVWALSSSTQAQHLGVVSELTPACLQA